MRRLSGFGGYSLLLLELEITLKLYICWFDFCLLSQETVTLVRNQGQKPCLFKSCAAQSVWYIIGTRDIFEGVNVGNVNMELEM